MEVGMVSIGVKRIDVIVEMGVDTLVLVEMRSERDVWFGQCLKRL